MKILTNCRPLSVAGVLLGTSLPSSAVLNFIETSWTGTGVDPVKLPNPGTNPNTAVRVGGTSGGTLTIPSSSLLQDRFVTATSVSVDVAVTGGTGDLQLANRTAFDNGAGRWDSIQLGGFSAGVSAVTFTVNYSNPVAGRVGFTGGRLDSGPLGSALGLVAEQVGVNNFNVSTFYGGTFTAADENAPLFPGPLVGTANASPLLGAGPNFQSTTGFSGLINSNLDSDFLLVDGYDTDGNGRDNADAPRSYITSQTWTITANNAGDFTPQTLFTLSLDGRQFQSVLVPEPSTALLGLGGLALVSLRRKR